MMRTKYRLRVMSIFLAVFQCSCGLNVVSEPEVSISVKNGCGQELNLAFVQFGENRTIGGALLPEKFATEGGLPFPVLLDEVEVHYCPAGQDFVTVTTVPLKSLVPEGIEGDFEVLFTVTCSGVLSIDTTFWQYQHDGDRYRKVKVEE